MVVRVEKCPVPVLWLDTAVFIKMAKIASREQLGELEHERIERLSQVVLDKVRSGRLLCPEGQQDEEFDYKRAEFTAARRAMLMASRAIRLRHPRSIEQIQFHHVARGYLDGAREVVLQYGDGFMGDPLSPRERDSAFAIRCYLGAGAEDRDERQRARYRHRDKLEALGKANKVAGIGFAELRDRELAFLPGTLNDAFNRAAAAIRRGDYMGGYLDFVNSYPMQLQKVWRRISGGIEGFREFIASGHYKAIPAVDIYANLYADVLTGGAIDDGDATDIDHLASVIPYCNYVLTDKKMRRRVRRLGLDSKYGTQVFAMADTVELISELEAL
ncbi:MAG: hypothetical protein IV100_06985 [Myxococcales bacterium]|nr:hypothetical protein [Myxococcales bacterium]